VSVVYTGSAIEPCTYTVTGPGGLSIGPLPVDPADYTDNVLPGTATATHNYPGDTNYNPSSDSEDFEITFCPTISLPIGMQSQTGGAAVVIPITTTDVTPGNLGGAEFTFTYDPAVLDPTEANISVTPGPVVGGATIGVNTTTPGTIIVAVYNPFPPGGQFFGAGVLVNINMQVNGPIGSSTALNLPAFQWYTEYPIGIACFQSPIPPGDLTVISGTITGNVEYKMDINGPEPPPSAPTVSMVTQPVPDAVITATGPTPVPAPAITDTDGDYSMSGFGPGPYTIAAAKTPKQCGPLFINGITSQDATVISQYIVGLRSMSADQIEAAQVSGLGFVNSLDATLVSRFTVCIANPGSLAGFWKFKPLFAPGPVDTINGGVYNYNALLMGDVTGDWLPTGPLRPTAPENAMTAVRASVPNDGAATGSIVNVPLRIDNLNGEQVESYQFSIRYDPTVVEPTDVAASIVGTVGEGLNVVHNVPEPGILMVAVYGAYPVVGDGVYANLQFRMIGAAGASSTLTIENFRYNYGTTYVVTSNGRLTVTENSGAQITGRLLTSTGQGIRNARVVLTSSTGQQVSSVSSSFGNFQFAGLMVGETYTVTVQSRNYRFAPQTVSTSSSATHIDMIAQD
jgi:hypothetical protein